MRFNVLVLVSISVTTALAQTGSPSTFWNDYPTCENDCHQNVWTAQSCSLQNSCGGCSGCLCLIDSCLCETPSWLEAVAQCIGQKCGSSAAVEAASIAASACKSNQVTLAVDQQQLASIGVAAATATTTTSAPTTTGGARPTDITATSTSSTGGSGANRSGKSGSGFTSPGAVAGYSLAAVVVALFALWVAWRQLRIAQKNRREKKAARRLQIMQLSGT